MERSVAADALRPCRAGDARSDRRGPRTRHLSESAGVRNPGDAERTAERSVESFHQPASTRPGVTTRSCAGARGSASAPVAVTRVWPVAPSRSLRTRRRPASSSDRASSRRRSGGTPTWEASSSASARRSDEDRHPLLALRPEGPEIAVGGEHPDLVEMRPEAGRPSLEVPREALVERGPRRRGGRVGERRVLEAELRGTLGEDGHEHREQPCPRLDELLPERHDLRRPRLERGGVGDAGGDPPEGRVALAERGRVRGRHVGTGRQDPGHHPVEVRAAQRRPALDDGQPVGGERQRVDAGAQLLGGAHGRAVPADPLRLSIGEPYLCRDGCTAALSVDPRQTGVGAVPHDLRVLARPERDALCGEVHGLEKVRLARAVPPGDEDEPRLEPELQPGVRADVAERHLLHDQVGAPSRRAGSA